jgi:hypothetical protein
MYCRQRSTLRRPDFGPKDGEHLKLQSQACGAGVHETAVLVQSEMEKKRFPLVKIPPLRGGDFQGMRIHRPMRVSRSFALAR